MAIETNLDDPLFLGTDRQFVFTITGSNISGWALSFKLKRRIADADADALLSKTTVSGIVISGTYSVDQVATVTVADTDTDTLPECLARFELKRTDANLETVLAYGTVRLVRGVHRT